MSEQKIWYGKLTRGCFLIKANDEEAATEKAYKIFGSLSEPEIVREASDADLGWNRSMQGVIHE